MWQNRKLYTDEFYFNDQRTQTLKLPITPPHSSPATLPYGDPTSHSFSSKHIQIDKKKKLRVDHRRHGDTVSLHWKPTFLITIYEYEIPKKQYKLQTFPSLLVVITAVCNFVLPCLSFIISTPLSMNMHNGLVFVLFRTFR